MDIDRNIRPASIDAPGDEDDPISLNLSLSIGPQPPRRPQLKPEQPPVSPMMVFPSLPPQHEEVHFLMSDASASYWPLAITPQRPLFFQVPQPWLDLSAQMLPPPSPLPQGGEVSPASFPAPRVPRNRGRVSGTCGALNWKGKAKTITPPYPWATDRRAVVHSYAYLMSKGLKKITGEMQCRRCERRFEKQYDLEEKFAQLWDYIAENRPTMHHRATDEWMNPVLPGCHYCQQVNCVRPVPTKKKAINWLFLLLGQLLGCCKLAELKYFCKHTSSHRTGAKDRVLYSTYLGICRQLDPTGPFHM